MDLHFQNPEWWQWVMRNGPRPLRIKGVSTGVTVENGPSLLREILVEICVIALSNPIAARLVFGMSPGVIEIVSGMPASEIDFIALTYARELQLRWADNLVFWKNLLLAAISGSEEDLSAVHLHSLQLVG